MGLYKNKKNKKPIKLQNQQHPHKVDADDRSTTSTLKVDANNLSLMSNLLDANRLYKNKKIKNQ
jgi:hypothetical protein